MNTATWWIKEFGIDKIKAALDVYWQQVEKAKKNSNMSMPKVMGAYVRKALKDVIRPKQESDMKNKSFTESFKKLKNWRELKITEKYCRVEDTGKEWYRLPEALFVERLMNFYENYCDYSERAYEKAI